MNTFGCLKFNIIFLLLSRGRCLNVHPSLLPDFAGGMDMDVHAEVDKQLF